VLAEQGDLFLRQAEIRVPPRLDEAVDEHALGNRVLIDHTRDRRLPGDIEVGGQQDLGLRLCLAIPRRPQADQHQAESQTAESLVGTYLESLHLLWCLFFVIPNELQHLRSSPSSRFSCGRSRLDGPRASAVAAPAA